MLKRLKTALAGLLLLVPLSLTAVELPPRVIGAVAPVSIGEQGAASAVRILKVIDEDGDCWERWLTGWHVIWDELNENLHFDVEIGYDGRRSAADVIKWDQEWDLALVETISETCIAHKTAKLNPKPLKWGSRVEARGFTGPQLGPMLSYGHIIQYRTPRVGPWPVDNMLIHTAPTYPGYSGGGLFHKGYLVGLIAGTHPRIHSVNIAVPGWRIQEFLDGGSTPDHLESGD